MSPTRRLLLLLVALGSVSPANANDDSDIMTAGPPAPPVAETAVMANANLDYTGTSPPRVQGALSAADPLYMRQSGDCEGPSQVGSAVYYETITITNHAGADAVFSAFTSNFGDPTACGIDTFLTAYGSSFLPGNSSANCITSNDDWGGGTCSRVTFPLAANATAVVVVTSYANGASFNYQVNFEAALQYRSPDLTDIQGLLDADDGTYNRLVGNCGSLSAIGTAVFYDTVLLTNDTNVNGTFSATTHDQGDPNQCISGDTFLAVYGPSFDPSNPSSNCIDSDDDGGPGVCSSVVFNLLPKKTVTLVVSSYGNGASFFYGLTVTGPVLFTDGFEGGGTSHWSTRVP